MRKENVMLRIKKNFNQQQKNGPKARIRGG
jgi:hypothetical protein